MSLNPYGATAAREPKTSGKDSRPSRRTIDAHCHLWVEEAAEIVKGHVNPMNVPASRYTSPSSVAQNKQQNTVDRVEHLTNLDQRLKDMDRQGIDMQLLLPVPFQAYYSVRNNIGIKAIQTVNEVLAKTAGKNPDRFVALGHLPLQDGEAAASEMERGVRELGLRGFQVMGSVLGTELSDRSLDPVWEMAEKLDILIVLHPNGYPQGDRFLDHYFNNIIGNPLDTTVALHHLIFDGTLENFPDLKILAVHGGGYLPAYAGRIDHAWGARPDCQEIIKMKPSTYLKKLYFDTVVFTYDQLEYLVKVFGSDHIILGTDYPYDMAEDDPIGHVTGTSSLTEDDISKIVGGNIEKLLKLN
ncbi:MAG: amidohydrolase family protein [Pseudomonadota bacterium]|nr:amidohydrolase family protein [Pseudomonadota bacterium]